MRVRCDLSDQQTESTRKSFPCKLFIGADGVAALAAMRVGRRR